MHFRQSRTEPRSQITLTENFVWILRYASGHTYILTDRNTYSIQTVYSIQTLYRHADCYTSHHSRGPINNRLIIATILVSIMLPLNVRPVSETQQHSARVLRSICVLTSKNLNCTKFDRLILRKIITTVATRCHILKLKCTVSCMHVG